MKSLTILIVVCAFKIINAQLDPIVGGVLQSVNNVLGTLKATATGVEGAIQSVEYLSPNDTMLPTLYSISASLQLSVTGINNLSLLQIITYPREWARVCSLVTEVEETAGGFIEELQSSVWDDVQDAIDSIHGFGNEILDEVAEVVSDVQAAIRYIRERPDLR